MWLARMRSYHLDQHRGRGPTSQSSANIIAPDPLSTAGDPTLTLPERCFGSNAGAKSHSGIVNPSSKASATTPKQPLNRWNQVSLSPQNRPPSLSAVQLDPTSGSTTRRWATVLRPF